jgi:hypothetical protein
LAEITVVIEAVVEVKSLWPLPQVVGVRLVVGVARTKVEGGISREVLNRRDLDRRERLCNVWCVKSVSCWQEWYS